MVFMKTTTLRRDILYGNSLQHYIDKELKDRKWLAKHAKFSQKIADELMKNLSEKNGFSQNFIMGVKARILNKLWRVGYKLKNSITGEGVRIIQLQGRGVPCISIMGGRRGAKIFSGLPPHNL